MTTVDDVRHQVLAIFGRRIAQAREVALDLAVVAAVTNRVELRDDVLRGLRIHLEQLAHRTVLVLALIAIDAHDHALTGVEQLLALARALGNAALDVALLDRLDDAAVVVD